MDDLISRQDVIDMIMGDGIYCDTDDDKKYSAERIMALPTAEPRKGKWIKDRLSSTCGGSYGVYRCSECESSYQDIGYGWNYCPYCGARMEE